MTDHFIPLRRSELVDILSADPDLGKEDRELFRRCCRMVAATCLCEYNRHLE